MRALSKTVSILCASPWSCLGLVIGLLGLATSGCVRRGPGILEFHGGAVAWAMEHLPGGPFAMALGHVVLGRTQASLDIAQSHEFVHVRQYERWGPLFGPAYLACALGMWLQGRDAYRDNPFEREAFENED